MEIKTEPLTWKTFYEECKLKFNDICIAGFSDLVRLIGCSVDEDDFYYILRNIKGERIYQSAVGTCDSLKGIYIKYDVMDNHFQINRCPREDVMIVEKDDKYIEHIFNQLENSGS